MTEIQTEELEALKAKADLLGVKYHPSIRMDKLYDKIKEHQAAAEKAENDSENITEEEFVKPASLAPVSSTKKVDAATAKILAIRAEAEKLIRIRVTCMNPAKKDWPGEIISVGNNAVGTLKKYVPFNADEGWHVPKMIFDVMKARECQIFVTLKSKNGINVRKGKLIKEFAIETMDPLTREDINELARRQAMAAGQD